ncbi:MAG: ABC transporter ATP-binding protein [Planctomycetota bacterium]|nr:ABC transporter ATP-binding protein [Planctomycetota bacterium]
MSIVSIQNLTKAYGSRPPALRDVSLEIEPGVTGLLGPNGAGKSTLLQCVLGLLPDFDGEVRVLGLDARRQRREVRRRVGFMPETDTYLYEMTGIRAVRLLGQLTGMPRNEALRRAHELLHHVGLGEAVYRDVKEYSTGMRQRFKLAQAMVHDPELVFLDEPLAGLDPKARDELLKLIKDLAVEHGKHVIWSSHILPDVQKVADSVVVLHHGRFRGRFHLEDLAPRVGRFHIEAEGDLEHFESALEAGGVTVIGADEGEGPETGGGTLVEARRGWTVDVAGDDAARKLFAIARESGVRVRSLGQVAEDLEDIFLRILRDPESD